ncbi:hypothetical protein [Kitasatospora sp. McL0602]|uniref:hypothetical protein n=1 Tax=Kitasatospora sp. McL0602 TaxID=3439530 RepID=UPI003F8B7222
MTDTPGWAPPSSPEPPREDAGPSAAPPTNTPQDAPPPYLPLLGAEGYGIPQPHGYGPQGWQHPGWGPPPSPKPGVIPLRPLGLGEILDGAVSTVRAHWRTAFGLSLGVAVVEQAISALAQLWQYQRPDDALPAAVEYAAYPLNILIGIIATGLLTIVVSKAVTGQPVTLREAWAAAKPRLGRLAGLTLLIMLIVGGILLISAVPLIGAQIGGATDPAELLALVLPILAAVPVAIWVAVQLGFAAPALMLEKQGIRASLARSRRLVKGSWWRIFGITLLGQILLGVVSMIILIPFTAIGFALAIAGGDSSTPFGTTAAPALILLLSVGGVIAATLTIPVSAGINVLLYVDQRIRREALDIELARAAGMPEQGAQPGPAVPGPAVPGQSGPGQSGPQGA